MFSLRKFIKTFLEILGEDVMRMSLNYIFIREINLGGLLIIFSEVILGFNIQFV
jgi:hypothetical protein